MAKPTASRSEFKAHRPTLRDVARLLLDIHSHVQRQGNLLRRLLMASSEMKAAIAKIDAATDNIAADLKGLKDAIKPGMTDAEVAEVQGLLDASAAKLEGIAASTEDVVPGV